jgi:hypothetical protein
MRGRAAVHKEQTYSELLKPEIDLSTDKIAENILDHLSDLKNYPEEALTPYEEFAVAGNTYYFTPGGFLYRKDPGTEEVGGFFCGYLTDKAWHYRIEDS